MAFKIMALIVILILLITDYVLVVIAHKAEERAERMYKAWKGAINEDKRSKHQP